MVDNASLPRTRQESLIGVQYQMALAAFFPEILFDVNRELLPSVPKIASFMKKIRILPSPELEKKYPNLWPAKVEVKCGDRTFFCEVLRPTWDSCEELGWAKIEAKFRRITAPIAGKVKTDRIIESVYYIDKSENLKSFVDLVIS
jgi:2-methylcitrate dehydratase PrpD